MAGIFFPWDAGEDFNTWASLYFVFIASACADWTGERRWGHEDDGPCVWVAWPRCLGGLLSSLSFSFARRRRYSEGFLLFVSASLV